MIIITPTCFATWVPSKRSLQTQRITSSSAGLVILCVCRLSEDATQVPKHVGVKLIMNCVLWFVCYCVILIAFVGRYIEYMKMHSMSNIKFRVEFGVCCPKCSYLHIYKTTHCENLYKKIYWYIQVVSAGICHTSGECSLG